jgi:hypothetical protein
MDSVAETPAERLYRKHKEQMKKQYEKHKDEWNTKRKEQYRLAHPNPNPRGRPPKKTDLSGAGVAATPLVESPI